MKERDRYISKEICHRSSKRNRIAREQTSRYTDRPIQQGRIKTVDKGHYKRLVGRLIYLSHTRPADIEFSVSVVGQILDLLNF